MMHKTELEWTNQLIGVTTGGMHVLLAGDAKLREIMDGAVFEDNCDCRDTHIPTFPDEPGAYLATVEYWFEQGYFEGYRADGESEWTFRLRDVRPVLDVLAAAEQRAAAAEAEAECNALRSQVIRLGDDNLRMAHRLDRIAEIADRDYDEE